MDTDSVIPKKTFKPQRIFNPTANTKITSNFVLISISIVLLLLFVNYSGPYQEVFGHAFVIDTNPVSGEVLSSPPSSVDAYINEPVDLTYSQISIIDSNGEQVDTGQLSYIDNDQSKLTVTLPPNLAEGTYTVSVRMLSQIDGHLTEDTFVFGLGEQGSIDASSTAGENQENIFDLDQVSVGSAIARFPALIGQVMIIGAAFCMLWLWTPINKIKWLNAKFSSTKNSIEYRTILLMITGAVILIISDFAMIFSLAYSINAHILDTINTTFGNVWLARTVLSFVMLGLIVVPLIKIKDKKKLLITKQPFVSDNRFKYILSSVIFALGLITLLTTSLIGHAAAVPGSFLPILLDFIHNIVASMWIGGVIYIAFVVAPVLKETISLKNSNRKKEKQRNKDRLVKIHDLKNKIQKRKKEENDGDGDDINLTLDSGELNDSGVDKNTIGNTDQDLKKLLTVNSVLSILIPKFSFIPVIILGVILLTGPFLLYILEDDLTLTLFSLYGIILAAKLILATIMIAIGIYYQVVIHKQSMNRLIIYTSTFINGSYQSQNSNEFKKTRTSKNIYTIEKIISKFNFGLKAEALIGLLLLGSVALLTNTGLPESETGIQGRQLLQDNIIEENINSQGYSATRFIMYESIGNNMVSNLSNDTNINNIESNMNNPSDFTKVLLSIEPFKPGNNQFTVSFLDANDNPIDTINDVNIKIVKTTESIGSVAVSVAPMGLNTQKVSPGVFSANTSFGFSGQWQVEIEGITDQRNASNLYTVFDPFVKPSLDQQMTFNITEFSTSFPSQPLYPVYDSSRNVIWVGDTILNSGKILEFNLDDKSYLQHNVSEPSVITQLALDTNNSIWYIDPLRKMLGFYDPQTQSTESYMLYDSSQPMKIGPVFSQTTSNEQQQQQQQPPLSSSDITESQGAPSAIGIDSKDNVWIAIANTNIVLKFDVFNKNFTKILLPTVDANPLGITVDERDTVWIAEGGSSSSGKIAKIDSAMNNYTVKEFAPQQTTTTTTETTTSITEIDSDNSTILNDPIFILPDPQGNEIYISEHEGNAISVFNPITETFRQITLDNKNALPFGMVFDVYNNLWVAEHLTNKITVIDPETEEQEEVTLPALNPFNQYLTTDSQGQVWAAEQRGNGLARVDVTVSPLSTTSEVDTGENNFEENGIFGKVFSFIEDFGFEQIVAPLIAAGIIVISLVYVRTVYNLSTSIERVKIMEGKEKKQ